VESGFAGTEPVEELPRMPSPGGAKESSSAESGIHSRSSNSIPFARLLLRPFGAFELSRRFHGFRLCDYRRPRSTRGYIPLALRADGRASLSKLSNIRQRGINKFELA